MIEPKSFVHSGWLSERIQEDLCALGSDKGHNNMSPLHIPGCFSPIVPALHFSHVFSYVISLEHDKMQGEEVCSEGHRPGSVPGSQLLIIHSYKRLWRVTGLGNASDPLYALAALS